MNNIQNLVRINVRFCLYGTWYVCDKIHDMVLVDLVRRSETFGG